MKRDGFPKTREGWEGRYLEGNTPWDLGEPPPILHDVVAAEAEPLRVMVPGAGRGHDAVRWAEAGHTVTMVDIAASAVVDARRLARASAADIEILEADMFELGTSYEGAYDVVWEHTCFCALPPEQRDAYAALTARWLKPDGRMIALLWNHGYEGGPPYDITPEITRAAFDPLYTTESLEPVVESAPGRSDEFLCRMRRRWRIPASSRGP